MPFPHNSRHPKTDLIVEKALVGLKPKQIARLIDVPYNTVRDIIRRYTKQVLVRKNRTHPDQLKLDL